MSNEETYEIYEHPKPGKPAPSIYGKYKLRSWVEEERSYGDRYYEWEFEVTNKQIREMLDKLEEIDEKNDWDSPTHSAWCETSRNTAEKAYNRIKKYAKTNQPIEKIKQIYDTAMTAISGLVYYANYSINDLIYNCPFCDGKHYHSMERAMAYLEQQKEKQIKENNPIRTAKIREYNFIEVTCKTVYEYENKEE